MRKSQRTADLLTKIRYKALGSWVFLIKQYNGTFIFSDNVRNAKDILTEDNSIFSLELEQDMTEANLEREFIAYFSSSSSILSVPDGLMDGDRMQHRYMKYLSNEDKSIIDSNLKVVRKVCLAISELPDLQKDVLIAREIFNFSLDEIAAVKKRAPNTIRSLNKKALDTLSLRLDSLID
ncbi:MAG: hypothetical protein HUJ53_06600 [Holdemanella sp.]|nr:hypothetical protein [Holdemanella sp.]